MGGRGSASSIGAGKRDTPFSVGKYSAKQLKGMGRGDLEKLATAIFANKAMAGGLSKAEGVRRASSLMSGNTDAQLRKYISRNS